MRLPWTVAGTLTFLRHPRWWAAPLAAGLVAMLLAFAAGGAALYRLWPVGTDTVWWQHLLTCLWALARAVLAAVVTWLVVHPPLAALAAERLARQALRAANGTPGPEETIGKAMASALLVWATTLPVRVLAAAVALLGPLFGGPLGVLAAAVLVAHVALIDAVDTALAAHGLDGKARIATLAAHRNDLRQALLPATLLELGLLMTVIGWLFWFPGLVCGAAKLVRDWTETKADPHA